MLTGGEQAYLFAGPWCKDSACIHILFGSESSPSLCCQCHNFNSYFFRLVTINFTNCLAHLKFQDSPSKKETSLALLLVACFSAWKRGLVFTTKLLKVPYQRIKPNHFVCETSEHLKTKEQALLHTSLYQHQIHGPLTDNSKIWVLLVNWPRYKKKNAFRTEVWVWLHRKLSVQWQLFMGPYPLGSEQKVKTLPNLWSLVLAALSDVRQHQTCSEPELHVVLHYQDKRFKVRYLTPVAPRNPIATIKHSSNNFWMVTYGLTLTPLKISVGVNDIPYFRFRHSDQLTSGWSPFALGISYNLSKTLRNSLAISPSVTWIECQRL